MDFTGQYALNDGRRLDVKGQSAYLVESDHYRYFAPKGAYVTTKGETFYIEDGRIHRMEAPPEVVYLDDINRRMD